MFGHFKECSKFITLFKTNLNINRISGILCLIQTLVTKIQYLSDILLKYEFTKGLRSCWSIMFFIQLLQFVFFQR